MRHPNIEEIICFVAGRADETLLERMYQHLVDCDTCTDRCRIAEDVRSDFDSSWDAFLVEARQRLESVALSGSTESVDARSSQESSADRESLTALVVRGFIDIGKGLASSCQDAMTAALSWQAGLVPSYRGVGSPDATPAVAEHIRRASDHLQHNRPLDTRRELELVLSEDENAVGTSRLDITIEGQPAGMIFIDAKEVSISVMIRPEFLPGTSVVSTLTYDDGDIRRETLEVLEGADYLLAEFSNVPGGSFRLGFEGA